MPRKKAFKYSAAVEKAASKEELMRKARLAHQIASEQEDPHQVWMMHEIAAAYLKAAGEPENEGVDNGR